MEQLDYNILFRWFVGLSMDDAVWNATVFSKNREWLLDGDIAQAFFEKVLELARGKSLLSDEHFTVDGTLVEAWAGHKSFKKKGSKTKPPDRGGNPTVDFSGEKRCNDTHESTTDPEAKLYRKSYGTESKLCYWGHVLMDNRHGLAVGGRVTQATSYAERAAAIELLAKAPGAGRATLGADKAYDVRSFVETLRFLRVTPHIASKVKHSAVDGRTTRHAAYEVSQRKRKLVEQIFGWLKTVGLMRKTRHRASGASAGRSCSRRRCTTWCDSETSRQQADEDREARRPNATDANDPGETRMRPLATGRRERASPLEIVFMASVYSRSRSFFSSLQTRSTSICRAFVKGLDGRRGPRGEMALAQCGGPSQWPKVIPREGRKSSVTAVTSTLRK